MKTINNILKRTSIVLLLFGLISFVQTSNAQILINGGFETGDLTGWASSGTATASTGVTYNSWVVNPADNYMGYILPPGGPNISGAEVNLGLASGSLAAWNPSLFANTTNWATLTQDIVLTAGQTVTVWWNFISTDYDPYNDGVIGTLTGTSFEEKHLLAVTSNPYGDTEALITGDYGSTGWHQITFTAGAAGTYRLGFAAFNISDTALDPWLMIDDAQGGTSAPGEPIVTTDEVTSVAVPTAVSGGSVTDNGGTPAITARGICWNTTGSPTTADSFTTDGTGFGSFTSTLSGLVSGQTYYVRAYGTNSQGTYYGGEVHFTVGAGAVVPISDWALYFGIFLIGLFLLFRFRRRLA